MLCWSQRITGNPEISQVCLLRVLALKLLPHSTLHSAIRFLVDLSAPQTQVPPDLFPCLLAS
jgi:hypothetical protein